MNLTGEYICAFGIVCCEHNASDGALLALQMSSLGQSSDRLSLQDMQESLQRTEPDDVAPTLASGLPSDEPLPTPLHETAKNLFPDDYVEDVHFPTDSEAEPEPAEAGYDSSPEHYNEPMPEGHERHEEGEDVDPDVDDPNNHSGRLVGEILCSVLSAPSSYGCPPYTELKINGHDSKLVLYRNTDYVEGNKKKKFFKLSPNPTPILFGWKHYQAVYNGHDSRGWLGYCGLVRQGAETRELPYVLIEVWETRCNTPRVDLIIYDFELEEVHRKERGLTWLRENELESDTQAELDRDLITRYGLQYYLFVIISCVGSIKSTWMLTDMYMIRSVVFQFVPKPAATEQIGDTGSKSRGDRGQE